MMASWCTGVLWSDYREHLCAFQGGCEEAGEGAAGKGKLTRVKGGAIKNVSNM